MAEASIRAANRALGAVAAGPLLTLAVFLVLYLVMLIAFTSVGDVVPRGRAWAALVYFAVHALPAILAPAAGSLLTSVLLGAGARAAAYRPILLFLVALTAVFVLWSANLWAVLLQLAASLLAWRLLVWSSRHSRSDP
jgi:hypothetical protein